MAKSLGIRTPAGFDNPDSFEQEVLSPVVASGNLGAIVMGILAAAADEMAVTVDIKNRVVHGRLAAGVDAAALIDAAHAGATVVEGHYQMFPATARSAVWVNDVEGVPGITIEPSGDAIENLLSLPELVKRTVGSAVSAIEDANAEGGPLAANANLFVVLDQATERLTVLNATDGAAAAAVRALFEDGGTLEDSVRFEQIPAAEAAGETALAFE